MTSKYERSFVFTLRTPSGTPIDIRIDLLPIVDSAIPYDYAVDNLYYWSDTEWHRVSFTDWNQYLTQAYAHEDRPKDLGHIFDPM